MSGLPDRSIGNTKHINLEVYRSTVTKHASRSQKLISIFSNSYHALPSLLPISAALLITPPRPDDEPPRVSGALSPIQTIPFVQRWIGL